MPKLAPRGWQIEALHEWERAGNRGIISVVTGGGKTVFALSCIDRIRPSATLIVVPTTALLEQWWSEAAAYFDLDLDEINIVTGNLRFRVEVDRGNDGATMMLGRSPLLDDPTDQTLMGGAVPVFPATQPPPKSKGRIIVPAIVVVILVLAGLAWA